VLALYIITGLYILFCGLFYFGQHLFFFRPEILPSSFKYEYEFPFTERTFEMDDGGTVNAIHFEVPNSKGVIYYLKGNSRSIKGWGKFAKDFLGKGYDFFMMDYRGFGKSKGDRSEHILYEDAQFVYDKMVERYGEDKIVLYGRSFGSGIAAYLASRNTPRMLILDSPYYNFRYQIGRFVGWLPLRWLLKYQLPTDEFLRKSTCPTFIIHGDRDYIISYSQGRRLAKESGATLITIKRGRHNNLPDMAGYQEQLYAILNQ
jgi:alpha-beta hydrolase superfamily lysophospholipase